MAKHNKKVNKMSSDELKKNISLEKGDSVHGKNMKLRLKKLSK